METIVIALIIVAVAGYVGLLGTAKNTIAVVNSGAGTMNTLAEQKLIELEEAANYNHARELGKLEAKWKGDKVLGSVKNLKAAQKAALDKLEG